MIENELKYVLSIPSQSAIAKACGKPFGIDQGYLPGKARIRSKRKGASKNSKFFFTYKLPVDDVLFEIEKEITEHEFKTLWPHTNRRLMKLRYVFIDGKVQWDIDYFERHDGSIYFAMAEAEMPEDMREPPRVPDFLQKAITYAVPRDRTKEFTSQKVSDPEYVATLTFA